MKAPNECPICGEKDGWKLIDTTKKGFNTKNALIGSIFSVELGLIAGFSGKNKSLYQCVKCGFSHEYDEVTTKQPSSNDFTNTGSNVVWINNIIRATHDCPFCGKSQNLYVKYELGCYRFKCGHCSAEFRCKFTFRGKIKSDSVQILNCGEINKENFDVGCCDASMLIKDSSMIKDMRKKKK